MIRKLTQYMNFLKRRTEERTEKNGPRVIFFDTPQNPPKRTEKIFSRVIFLFKPHLYFFWDFSYSFSYRAIF